MDNPTKSLTPEENAAMIADAHQMDRELSGALRSLVAQFSARHGLPATTGLFMAQSNLTRSMIGLAEPEGRTLALAIADTARTGEAATPEERETMTMSLLELQQAWEKKALDNSISSVLGDSALGRALRDVMGLRTEAGSEPV